MNQRNNLRIVEAFKVAAQDMKPVLKELRQSKMTFWTESWVVGVSELDSPEVRRMNRELGLNSVDGLNQWYKQ
jgi:hypothetical protein